MKFARTISLASLLLAAYLPSLAAADAAATFPDKPVRMIVPWPPGGSTDLIARMMAKKLNEQWKVPVVVENKPGASGIIGSGALAKAAPDGYTIGWIISTHAVNPSLHKELPYDSRKDFAPVALIASMPDYLVVNPKVPAKNLQDLVVLMKKQPGKMTFASAGTGTSTHLAGELFKQTAGVDIIHVPYKGGSPAITDLTGGQVDLMFANSGSILPFIRGEKVPALAVTSAARNAEFTATPTVAESGYPDFEVNEWYGLAAPAGTPSGILEKIQKDVLAAAKDPDFQSTIANQFGGELTLKDRLEFEKFIGKETERWSRVIKSSGIAAQ
ncbi:tripartite tricarboxylate transporter substrate binding protein [Bordetella sp. BOR01]|uniref:tripartite tricarboxylate transporter substrate binding protein n=1 Tax=Bordetella sp. BOR01 TaxID=2854779 RepID=UPI001C494524|nr:tripartite tricarboxylate transporter substrate binding protein [Bordetella sp. BOR01]MBV7483760.1 tripartite tricarboxylate transporter substrate binding protein [Bordetella sp. BOR01]